MITLDAISLPDDLEWVDETDWTPVEQTTEYSLEGALVIDAATKQAGRPITLTHYEGDVWVSRATVLALMAMAAVAGKEMTLTLWNGETHQVMFRFDDGPPVEAAPIHPLSPPADDDWYTLTLRLMEI